MLKPVFTRETIWTASAFLVGTIIVAMLLGYTFAEAVGHGINATLIAAYCFYQGRKEGYNARQAEVKAIIDSTLKGGGK